MTSMGLNGGAGFTACGPAFQRVQPAGRPAAGRDARLTAACQNLHYRARSCASFGGVTAEPDSRKNHTSTPARTTAPPTYRPHDQPNHLATSGVTVGASMPPRLPPVLKIAPPVPACLPLASIAAAQ